MDTENVKEVLNKSGKTDQFIRFLEMDDTLKFGCKCCGNCCSNRGDIIMTPYDIYRIAKATNKDSLDVIKDYCDVTLGSNSCLPIVTLMSDNRNLCPFLKYDITQGRFGCSINNSKPGSCILHPIGVVRSFDLNNGIKEKKFFEVKSCPNHDTDTEVKVKDFIKPYLDCENEFDAGYELISTMTFHINTVKFVRGIIRRDEEYINENFTEEEKEHLNNVNKLITDMVYKTYVATTLQSMYEFDTNKGFLEQIDEMKERVVENALKIIAVFDGLNIDLRAKEFSEDEQNTYNKIKTDFDAHCEEMMQKFEEHIKNSKEEEND